MRDKLTLSMNCELCRKLKKLSELARIPASRLFDEAVEDLLEKHNYVEIVKKKSIYHI